MSMWSIKSIEWRLLAAIQCFDTLLAVQPAKASVIARDEDRNKKAVGSAAPQEFHDGK